MNLTIRAMTQTEFDQYQPYGVTEFAKDKMRALNLTWEDALALSRSTLVDDLPEGIKTPDNYFYTAVLDNAAPVGILWIVVKKQWGKTTVFIYDIEIKSAFRGQGYGRALMAHVDDLAKQFNASRVTLHVFGHNKRAFKLYQKLGFETTDVSMAKEIN